MLRCLLVLAALVVLLPAAEAFRCAATRFSGRSSWSTLSAKADGPSSSEDSKSSKKFEFNVGKLVQLIGMGAGECDQQHTVAAEGGEPSSSLMVVVMVIIPYDSYDSRIGVFSAFII
jgi:hypothetical protein